MNHIQWLVFSPAASSAAGSTDFKAGEKSLAGMTNILSSIDQA